jgi:hypothetical protein
VTSAAIVFFPLAVICFAISSGCANCSIMLAMSPAWADVSMSGVNVRSVPDFGAMAPASMNIVVFS